MQASKIKIGKVYAYQAGEYDPLVRFSVSSVTTKRVNDYGNPHDYDSTVEGYIIETDPKGMAKRGQLISVKPEKLKGPYEEHVELVERQKTEKQIAEQKERERKRQAAAVEEWLWGLSGLAKPQDKTSYMRAYRTDNYGGIDISADGVAALYQHVLKLKEKTNV